MNRQITQEQTEELFKVCRNNGVSDYDVQIELVDHMASSIEQHWTAEPKDPFKYALYKAFRKFGASGFNKVKEQKQRALARKYNRVLWQYMLEFYRWPKMLLTLAISFGVFLLFKNVNELHWIFVFYMLVLCAGAVVYDLRYKTKHKIKTIPDKSFMLLAHLKQIQTVALAVCQLPVLSYATFTLLRSLDISLPNNNYITFLIALIVVSSIIALFGYFFYIPKKIKEHFMEQFAEFVV